MKYCAVFGCYSNESFGSKRNFFHFPNTRSKGQIQRSLLWRKFCRDPTLKPLSKHLVCDLHFQKSDFIDSDQLRLKETAVPSRNGPKKNPKLDKSKKKINQVISLTSNCENDNLNSPGDLLPQNQHHFGEHNYSIDRTKETSKLKIHLDSTVLVENEQICDSPKTKHANEDIKFSSGESVKNLPILTKRNNAEDTCKCSFETYETTEDDIVLKLHPHNHGDCGESEGELNSFSKRNLIFKSSQKLNMFENSLEIRSTSTIYFESDDDEEETAANSNAPLGFANSLSLETPKVTESVFSSVENVLHQSTVIDKTSFDSLSNLPAQCVSHSPPQLPAKLEQFIQLKQNKVEMIEGTKSYISKLNKKKQVCRNLDINDPKYSIAATAESLGTFDSYIDSPLEKVDLNADEWHKLYTPSEITFPKLSDARISPMVNELRSKLSSLKERDKLDVSFLLSLMSVYPKAPKHIKELLFQRLSLVYVATMFKWDTALALGNRAKKPASNSAVNSSLHTMKSENNNTTYLEDMASLAEHKPNFKTTDVLGSKKPKLSGVSKKLPKIAFEVIVQERAPKTKEDEKTNVKTL